MEDLYHQDKIRAIGNQYDKSAAQVILRWLIQREIVAIPKSVHEERITENVDVFDFELILSVVLTYTVGGRFGAMERSAG